jgi:Family of unknown function (DUF5335)
LIVDFPVPEALQLFGGGVGSRTTSVVVSGSASSIRPSPAILSEERGMVSKKLEKAEWQAFFERLSRLLEGKQTEIEAVGLSLGDQIQVEWTPLLGLVYDPKDDILELVLERLDHIIRKPREIYAEIGADRLANLEVVDADGVQHVVKLREPLMLPRPQQ